VPRAVLFAITDDDRRELETAATDDERVEYVTEVVEERWDEGFVCELDKAWDALHRALTDGRLEWDNDTFPLNAAILGKDQLNGEGSYIIGLTPSKVVPDVARALAAVTDDQIRQGYARIDPADYGPEHGPEDLEYTLEWFRDLPGLWARAAEAGRSVILAVDQ
jgi:hypothetical protein